MITTHFVLEGKNRVFLENASLMERLMNIDESNLSVAIVKEVTRGSSVLSELMIGLKLILVSISHVNSSLIITQSVFMFVTVGNLTF